MDTRTKKSIYQTLPKFKAINLDKAVKLYDSMNVNLDRANSAKHILNDPNMSRYHDDYQKTYEFYWDKYEQERAEFFETINSTITPELDKVQARCSARLIWANDIIHTLSCIQDELDIPKTKLNGVMVKADIRAENLPKSYYRNGYQKPQTTQFEAVFKNGHWVLTDLYRNDMQNTSSAIYIEHTEASKAALIDRFTRMDRFSIKR